MSEQAQAVEATIPKDLQDQIGAIRALATTYNLLDKGLFNHTQAQAVRMSLEFVKALYEKSVEEAFNHPEADKSPELMSLKGEANE